MSTYITQADLELYLSEERLRMLTDDDKSGTVDSIVVGEAIDGAESEVDMYLANAYSLPLATVPSMVAEWATQLTTFRLFLRRGQVPEQIAELAKTARAQLLLVSQGKIKLDGLDLSNTNEGAYVEPSFSYSERSFTRTKLTGW